MHGSTFAITLTALVVSCSPSSGGEPVVTPTATASSAHTATRNEPTEASQGIRCGTATCTGTTPNCSVAKAGAHDAKCTGETRGSADHDIIQCRTQRDCKAGMHCNIGMGGTWCSTKTQDSTYTIVCEHDEQCASLDKEIPLTTPHKCVPYGDGYDDLKGCLGAK